MARLYIDGQKADVLALGGGGGSADTVLTDGVISTDSSYATASFNEISDYEYVLIRFRTTVSGVDYVDYKYIAVADIVGELTLTVRLHWNVSVGLTTTAIRATGYSGSCYYIYADIVAFENDLFS